MNIEKAYFGGGCFWCVEAVFGRLEWVMEVHSGYMGGTTENPTYDQVSMGRGGHIEVIEVVYDRDAISYETLLAVFFATHDPTSMDRQWADAWVQYRSIIFGSEDDLRIAKEYIEKLDADSTFASPIVTELRWLSPFYIAEDYHQNYYNDNSDKPYCTYVIDPKIAKLREKFSKYLKKES